MHCKKKLIWVMSGVLFLILMAGIFDLYMHAMLESRLTSYSITFNQGLPGRTVTENGINGDFYCSKSDQPRKAVIILGGSEGGKHWSSNTAYVQQLLDDGYCVLILAYFHAPGLPDDLREIPLEYFEKTFEWLATQEQVITDEYAVFGHSRGGELALLLASRYPQIKTTIALAPSSVLFPSSPHGFFDLLSGQHSAWSYQGEPLPFVPWPISFQYIPSLVTLRQREMFEQALRNDGEVKSAVIPIEQAHGPVLCMSSSHDEIWPSPLMCDQIIHRLEDSGFSFYYEQISHDYSHGWCGLKDCWGKVVNFLDEYFK